MKTDTVKCIRALSLLGVSTALLLGSAQATIFNVTNLFDSGAGSLREAITFAEADSDFSQINFQVSGTVNVASAFPEISTNMAISSNGFAVTLDGAGGSSRAFTI
ncbi:MAG: hypothetical protein AAF546_13390, partial [Verrucomicrobiota bacterium]